ncbi:hypothetical protein [Deinococcus actinosclerus]|uniref:Integral membrane protein n=1 Tax=Deinococcus actinosclerus TaxID=1768108 RepID=A0ABM5X661_9DEIO|nr:hypothetical protein [Deinococcus actinosclerus]ALW89301.1 hypothetical protein AUC44_10665 [Deinococcus actinosclerus]
MTTPDGAGPAPSVSTGALFLVILTFAVAFNTLSLTVVPEGRPLRIVCAALPFAALLWTAVAVWRSRGVPSPFPAPLLPVCATLLSLPVSGAALRLAQGEPLAAGQWAILGLGLLAFTGAAIYTHRTGAR